MTGIARRRVLASMAAGALATPGVIRAQGIWKPDKPITIYNPLAAGGGRRVRRAFAVSR